MEAFDYTFSGDGVEYRMNHYRVFLTLELPHLDPTCREQIRRCLTETFDAYPDHVIEAASTPEALEQVVDQLFQAVEGSAQPMGSIEIKLEPVQVA